MPEHIRALIVVLFLASAVFAIARRPACQFISVADYTRWRNTWFALTLTLFLSHNIWIYTFIAGTILIFQSKRETNVAALFLLLIFCAPSYKYSLPGLGLVNYLFELSHARILALVVLLPAYLSLISRKNSLPFGKILPDKLLGAYIVMSIVLFVRDTTLTNTLREALYQFTDVFLPYFVISRSITSLKSFQGALFCFVIAAMVLALIGVFESLRGWLLYSSLRSALDAPSSLSGYLERSGLTRASATVGNIPLGYVETIGIGFYLYLQSFIRSKLFRRLGFILLIAGLLAALSRGPWVGAVFLALVFIATGRRALRSLVIFGAVGLASLLLIAFLPGGERFLDLLPFIGSAEQGNVTYRERLLENSLIVINRSPFFGSTDYLQTPEMQSMIQGQGIIDLVNTYLQVALETGYVGLSLFAGFFVSVCWETLRKLKRLTDKSSEEHLLGRALLGALAAILLIIFTVSSVGIIPLVYWSVGGLGVAYITMTSQRTGAKTVKENL